MLEPPVRQGWLRWRGQQAEGIRQPRVVLECPDDADPARVARSLADAGYDVTVCSGPTAGHRCTLVETRRCGLIEDADAVVNVLGTDRPERIEVEPIVRTTYPFVPVVVRPKPEAGTGDVDELIALVDRAVE